MVDFRPEDFLIVAELIKRTLERSDNWISSHPRAWMRTAISRAYYAAFLTIKKKFPKEVGLGRDVHKKAADLLKQFHRFLAYQRFMSLRKIRNQADYDLPPEYVVSLKDVRIAIELAHFVIKEVKKLP